MKSTKFLLDFKTIEAKTSAKIRAIGWGKSLNQYLLDLINGDIVVLDKQLERSVETPTEECLCRGSYQLGHTLCPLHGKLEEKPEKCNSRKFCNNCVDCEEAKKVGWEALSKKKPKEKELATSKEFKAQMGKERQTKKRVPLSKVVKSYSKEQQLGKRKSK